MSKQKTQMTSVSKDNPGGSHLHHEAWSTVDANTERGHMVGLTITTLARATKLLQEQIRVREWETKNAKRLLRDD